MDVEKRLAMGKTEGGKNPGSLYLDKRGLFWAEIHRLSKFY